MSDNDYNKLSESIKLIFDLTSRIDERVKILIEQQNSTNNKVEKLVENDQGILSRIAILESKDNKGLREQIDTLHHELLNIKNNQRDLEKEKEKIKLELATLNIYNNQNVGRWQWIGDATFKVFMATMAAILAWKLGIGM